ncbi:MAG: prolyl oligopeptidase family serine peptidase, partial [Chitinophagaceae bacterium]
VAPVSTRAGSAADQKTLDSLNNIIDSLRAVLRPVPAKNIRNVDALDADEDTVSTSGANTATDLVLRDLLKGTEKIFKNVLEYFFSKNGQHLLIEQSRDPKEPLGKALVLYYDVRKGIADTLSRGGSEFKNFAISEDGTQVAYVAERDAKPKDLQKFYKLWYYKPGMDSASSLADKATQGMKPGLTVSEYGEVSFSKSGKKLFFGTAPIQPPRDTTLVDIDLARLDIWHYNDDYIQPMQLNRLRRDLQESFLAVYFLDQNKMLQLGSKEIPGIIKTNEGDGEQFVGVTDFGKRIEGQWEGTTKKDIYAINVSTGEQKLVKKDLSGTVTPLYQSPTGKYITWYDSKAKNYFVWDGQSTKNITEKIKVPLYDEDHDSPSDAPPYGMIGWQANDAAVLIYDRYDVWKVDPAQKVAASVITDGRQKKTRHRYIKVDSTQLFFSNDKPIYFRVQNMETKETGIASATIEGVKATSVVDVRKDNCSNFAKAKDSNTYILTMENYQSSPNLFVAYNSGISATPKITYQLSKLNPQQSDYNWGTAELVHWKAYDGKQTDGIVYKPENFDPAKKYPMICYFYETLSDGLYTYSPPAPTASRLNISFFVSRGYIVFAPDIHYSTGHPGKDAYDYIVSGTRALVKKGYVDSTRMGLQGQSWGGYQAAYLITVTNLFKAAWAGAPVANMTSAYGGIRWESGSNRQFQYERTQSRIGASLWEKPNLYIESSPLFRLPKVKTPLVIMSNDADGAVPWYQGIELFTGMRRLGKQVWLLNYNGEAHNLVERRNRKDIQIREQQFFDWQLKGEKPARWLTEGVPAVKKGKDWGLD